MDLPVYCECKITPAAGLTACKGGHFMHRILKIGMDVHTKNYTLCAVEPILGQEENILAQIQVAPSHTFVLDFIKKLKQQPGVTDKESFSTISLFPDPRLSLR